MDLKLKYSSFLYDQKDQYQMLAFGHALDAY